MSVRYPTGGRKPWFRQTVEVARAGTMDVYGNRDTYTVLYAAAPAHVERNVSGLMPELRSIGGEVEDFIRVVIGSEVTVEYGDRITFDGRAYTAKKITPIFDYSGLVQSSDILAVVLRSV